MKTKTGEKLGQIPITKQIFSRDKITGQIEELGEVELHTKSKNRNTGFFMVWLQEIRPKDLKTKVLFFLIRNMSNRGSIRMTNDQLAKKFECCEKTIQTLKQNLKKEGYIKYEPKYIYINPNFVWKGSAKQRDEAESFFRSL